MHRPLLKGLGQPGHGADHLRRRILLGLLGWSSSSPIPAIIGHTIMDIGLFVYWWTGSYTARPIDQTGVDRLFIIACCVFVLSLAFVLFAITRLRRLPT